LYFLRFKDDEYKKKLALEYTFEHPLNFKNVSIAAPPRPPTVFKNYAQM
jgi:hypothetical protein